uniref:Uncharacterized protein n=2 Tax=Phlebotomus papatasi TaxID=29031 RepID=A0A1B0DIM9_PHLPP
MIFMDKLVPNTVKCALVICLGFFQVQYINGQRCTIPDVEDDNLIIEIPMIPIGPPSTLTTYNMENTVSIRNITNI